MNKVENVLLHDAILLATLLEHIYGTCMLAIAIDSEYKMNIDLQKTILMIALHEVEEIQIGDLTPFDNITPEEKMKKESSRRCYYSLLGYFGWIGSFIRMPINRT